MSLHNESLYGLLGSQRYFPRQLRSDPDRWGGFKPFDQYVIPFSNSVQYVLVKAKFRRRCRTYPAEDKLIRYDGRAGYRHSL